MRNRDTIPAGGWLDIFAVTKRLQKQVTAAGGQKAWADKHKISAAYVCDVLQGRRLPGDKITVAMGLEKALLWRTPSH